MRHEAFILQTRMKALLSPYIGIKMRKKAFLLWTVFLMTMTAQAQLLYRISGNNLEKPSYIVGTYHLAPSAYVDSIPGLRATIDEVGQVCGELDMSLLRSQENVIKMTQAMMLPEGQTLQSLLSEEEQGRLNALMKELMGVDLTNPMVGSQLGKMTPQAISTQLTLMMYMKVHPGSNANDGIDDYLQTAGAEKGKKIMGLETVDQQVKALFLSTTLDRQKQLLMCMVDNKDYQLHVTEEIIKAYFSQDLERIKTITDEKLGNSCDSREEEENILIYDRNADWVKKMPAIMAETSTLFAVGAAHLVGEKGVLTLLRNAGYQVDGMK